jgi:hypothetical protein
LKEIAPSFYSIETCRCSIYDRQGDAYQRQVMSGRLKGFPVRVWKKFQDERPELTEDKAYKVFKKQFYDFIRVKWNRDVQKSEAVLTVKLARKQMHQARIERKLRRECGLAGCMERLRASGELISNSMDRLRLSECGI